LPEKQHHVRGVKSSKSTKVLKVELLSQAEDELSDAYDWYEEQQIALGNKFYNEINHYLNLIEHNPYQFPVRYTEELRSASLNKFPFLILYLFFILAETLNIFNKSEIEIPNGEALLNTIKKLNTSEKFRNQNLPLHMPYKEREISKMYYTMGEVAILFDVNQSLLRFYEKEFELQTKRNKKGNRYFTSEDIEILKIIFHLTRDKGYTLNGAKEYLKNNMADSKDSHRVISSLENLKKFLIEVRDQL